MGQPTETSPLHIYLKSYRCHKRVWAAKIERVMPAIKNCFGDGDGLSATLIMDVEGNRIHHPVSSEYIQKHKPEPGMYFVLYEDGYESASPAGAFESGYVAEGGDPIKRRDVKVTCCCGAEFLKVGGSLGNTCPACGLSVSVPDVAREDSQR